MKVKKSKLKAGREFGSGTLSPEKTSYPQNMKKLSQLHVIPSWKQRGKTSTSLSSTLKQGLERKVRFFHKFMVMTPNLTVVGPTFGAICNNLRFARPSKRLGLK